MAKRSDVDLVRQGSLREAPAGSHPRTRMTLEELRQAEARAPWGNEREAVANAAIARAIEDGQVVPAEMLHVVAHRVLDKVAANIAGDSRQIACTSEDIHSIIASVQSSAIARISGPA